MSNKEKGCNIFYKLILKGIKRTTNSQTKWERELDCKVTNKEWQDISVLPFKMTKDTKLQCFQYRILNHIIATNRLLYQINLRNDDLCSFCGGERETLIHLFFQCRFVKLFWNKLKELLQMKLHIAKDQCNLSARTIIFGLKGDNTFNVVLLLAKFHIYKARVQNTKPNIYVFLIELNKYVQIQKYIAVCNMKQIPFDKKWDFWKNLCL